MTTATKPVHQIKWGKSVVAQTLCGVDPYRKGVQTNGVRGEKIVTCKKCLVGQQKIKS